MLENLIKFSYPYPIAATYQNIESIVYPEEMPHKYNRLIDLYDCILKSLNYSLLGLAIHHRHLNADLKKKLEVTLKNPIFPNWTDLLATLLESLATLKDPLVENIRIFYYSPDPNLARVRDAVYFMLEQPTSARKVKDITVARFFEDFNRYTSQTGKKSGKTYSKAVEVLMPVFREILERIEFFKDYAFAYVSQITLEGHQYDHTLDVFSGLVPTRARYLSDNPLPERNRKMYLFKITKEGMVPQFCLHPFITAHTCSVHNKNEVYFLRYQYADEMDYYCFQCRERFRPDRLLIDFHDVMDSFIGSSKLEVSDDIIEIFRELLQIAWNDRILSDEERQKLEFLRKHFHIPETLARNLEDNVRRELGITSDYIDLKVVRKYESLVKNSIIKATITPMIRGLLDGYQMEWGIPEQFSRKLESRIWYEEGLKYLREENATLAHTCFFNAHLIDDTNKLAIEKIQQISPDLKPAISDSEVVAPRERSTPVRKVEKAVPQWDDNTIVLPKKPPIIEKAPETVLMKPAEKKTTKGPLVKVTETIYQPRRRSSKILKGSRTSPSRWETLQEEAYQEDQEPELVEAGEKEYKEYIPESMGEYVPDLAEEYAEEEVYEPQEAYEDLIGTMEGEYVDVPPQVEEEKSYPEETERESPSPQVKEILREEEEEVEIEAQVEEVEESPEEKVAPVEEELPATGETIEQEETEEDGVETQILEEEAEVYKVIEEELQEEEIEEELDEELEEELEEDIKEEIEEESEEEYKPTPELETPVEEAPPEEKPVPAVVEEAIEEETVEEKESFEEEEVPAPVTTEGNSLELVITEEERAQKKVGLFEIKPTIDVPDITEEMEFTPSGKDIKPTSDIEELEDETLPGVVTITPVSKTPVPLILPAEASEEEVKEEDIDEEEEPEEEIVQEEEEEFEVEIPAINFTEITKEEPPTERLGKKEKIEAEEKLATQKKGEDEKFAPPSVEERARIRRVTAQLLTEAKDSLQKENFVNAYRICNNILNMDPDNLVARLLRGRCAIESENYEVAYEDLDLVLSVKRDDSTLLMLHGKAALEIGELEKALEDLDKVVDKQPNNPEVWLLRGMVYMEMEKHKRAIKDFNMAIKINLDDPEAYLNRGNAYIELKEYEKAVEEYTKAIKIEPQDSYFYFQRGNAHFLLKDYKMAIRDFSNAIQLDPEDYDFYVNRGVTYKQMGQYDKALEDLTKVIEDGHDFTMALSQRGSLYSQIGKFDEAIKDFTMLIKEMPDEAEGYAMRGHTYLETGKVKKAMRDFRKALKKDSGFVNAHLFMANAYIEVGKLDNAISAYSNAIKLDPYKSEAYLNRGIAYEKKGDMETARKDFGRYIALNRLPK